MIHQKTRLRLALCLPLMALLTPLGAQTTPSTPPTPSDDTQTLPQFTVKGTQGDAYHATDVQSVARVAGDIMDTPLSVSVVTPELISDLGANAAYDVARYMPGVSNGRGTGSGGISDREDFRGFESFSKTVDSFSSFLLPSSNGFQANWDPAFIERAELVMGPDSILSPTGTPGGSINILTKSPSFTRSTDLSTSVGNYNAGKTVVDTTGGIGSGDKFAYRVIADTQQAEQFMPGSLRQTNLSLQGLYQINDTTKLTVKYFGEDWELTGAIANPNDDGEMVYTADTLNGTLGKAAQPDFDYRGWNGDTTWSHRFDRVNIGSAELTSVLFNKISVRLGAQLLYDEFTQDAGYPSGTVKETFNAATGLASALAPTWTIGTDGNILMPEVAYFSHNAYRGEQVQNDYAGNFKLGPLTLKPVAGWAYQQGRTFDAITSQDAKASDMPAADLGVGYYDPVHPQFSNYSFVSNKPSSAVQTQVYGMTQLGLLNDRIIFSGGVSRTYEKVSNYTDTNGSGITPTGPYTDQYLNSSIDNYIGGVVVKILPNVMAYGSYSTNGAITANNANQPIWQAGKQFEFGVKSEFLDNRLEITVDHFQISENNLSSTNPLYNLSPLTQPPFLIYDAVNHGYEAAVTGGITRNLSVIVSGTVMDYRDTYGRRYRNVPDTLANVLLNYHFKEGVLNDLNVFVGMVHEGNTAGESVTAFTSSGVPEQPSFYVPAWTVFNTGAGYTWRHLRFNLNVDNALNTKFWWQPAGRNSVSSYPSITYRLNTSYHF